MQKAAEGMHIQMPQPASVHVHSHRQAGVRLVGKAGNQKLGQQAAEQVVAAQQSRVALAVPTSPGTEAEAGTGAGIEAGTEAAQVQHTWEHTVHIRLPPERWGYSQL